MACLKKPTAVETLLETALICSYQSKEQSICILSYYFKVIIANFQFQVFILTFENAEFLLGRNKHGVSFLNIQGKLVALQPSEEFPKVAVNSPV